MIARYSSAVATGSLVTLGLFLIMNALVALQPGAYTEPRKRWTLDIWRIEAEDTPVERETPRIDDSFVQPPELPRSRPQQDRDGYVTGVTTAPPSPQPSIGFSTGFSMNDGPLVSVVLVQPEYPANMAAQGLEGWVLVVFDVLADGSVSNARVVESSHRGFERAALKAAERCRFRPRVVDGVPLASPGVQYRFTFQMEN